MFSSYTPSASSAPPAAPFIYLPLSPGQSLANGRFIVRQALSKGGMGAIYLASDTETFGRLVVVKAMLDYFDPTDARALQEARARFLHEARTLSLLRHPAIPQIFTYFQDGPHNYIVMEYIEGHDLEQLLTRRDDASGQIVHGQAYPQPDVLRWGVALCQVLVYLAGRQPHAVVHHDIKPANLLLDSSSDDIRLVDFGTAKARLLAISGSVGLQQSSVHGTQGYAAPEQYRGQSEPRSDVYALAATLYHLATDDDPRAHPFSFPQLARLGAFGQALRPALDADPGQRPTAAQLQLQLELLSIPGSARPLQAPDGSDLGDVGALVAWCEQHWRTGADWLYDQLPAQIELWWGQTKLAHNLRAIVKRYRHDTSAGLDAALALLDPKDFGAQQPQIISAQPRLDFGALTSKNSPERTLKLSNPGRRYAQADVKPPDWVLSSRSTIGLPPGQQLALRLTIDTLRANKRGKLSADILLQDSTTTLLNIKTQATISRWQRIWRHGKLLAATGGVGIALLWSCYGALLVNQLQSVSTVASDPNADHYHAAVASMSIQDWDRAINEFQQLTGTYYDDGTLLQLSYYNGAKAALGRNDWISARSYLNHIIDYSDARKLLQDSYVLEAQQTGALLILDANARRATFGPANRLLIRLDNLNTFEIRQVTDGRLLHTFNGLPNSQVLDVAWSPDGQTLAASQENGLIKFARAEDGATLRIIEAGEGDGQALVWSPDGRTLASYGHELVEIWNADGRLLQTLTVNQPGISLLSVAFSPDGQVIATSSNDGSIKLWRASDGEQLNQIEQQTTGAQQMIFRDQGRVLAAVVSAINRDAQLWFWRVSDGSLQKVINLQTGPTDICVFSPDGQMIATAIQGDQAPQVIVLRVADGQVLKRFSSVHSNVVSITFSADGKQLAFVDGDGQLIVNRVQS